MLKLIISCASFETNSRLIIVIVQVGAVKIYVAAVEALRKKERQDESQSNTKIDGFLSFSPPLNANVFVLRLE